MEERFDVREVLGYEKHELGAEVSKTNAGFKFESETVKALERIANQARSLSNSTAALLCFLDGQSVRVEAVAGVEKGNYPPIRTLFELVSDTANGVSILLGDNDADAKRLNAMSVDTLRPRTASVFPIVGRRDEKLVGGLCLLDNRLKPLNAFELSAIEGLVDHVGTLVDFHATRTRIDGQESVLRMIVDSIPLALVYGNEKREIIDVNKAFVEIFGYSKKEVVGKSTAMFYADQSVFQNVGKTRFSLAASQDTDPYEIEYRRKDGTSFVGRTVGSVLKDVRGNFVAMLGMIEDTTEKRALTKSYRASQFTIDQTSDAIFWVDANGGITYANERSVRLLEYSAKELLQLSISQIDSVFDLSGWQAHWKDVKREQIVNYNTTFRRKDQSTCNCEVTQQYFEFENDEFVVASVKDVSEQMSSLDLLAQTQERFELAVAVGDIGFGDVNLADGSAFYSLEWHRQIGETMGTITSLQQFKDRVHPDDLTRLMDEMSKYIDGQTDKFAPEYRAKHGDGSYRWFLSRGKLIVDENGRPSRLVGTRIDITERKTAEETIHAAKLAAEESERRFREIANSSKPLFWITELDSTCSWLNNRWLEYSGKRLDEQIGYGWAEVIHPDDREHVIEAYQNAFSKQIAFETSYRLRRHDGEYRWHLANGSPRHDENGRFVGYVGVSFDDHDARESHAALAASEIRLLESLAELKKVNHELEQFAFVASHDLKQPLRGIDNLAKWILEDADEYLPEQSRIHLSKLIGRIKRMEKLLDDLLMYSRVDRIQREVASVELSEMVSGLVGLLDPPQGFEIDVDNKLESHVQIDRAPFELVLRNLIGNAVKHHDKQQGRIYVRFEWKDENRMLVTVKDDGPGIAEEYHQKIFRLFSTLRPRDDLEGSGMGLAIVKKTVEAFGGEIKLRSSAGEGAAFSFTWLVRKQAG